MIRLPSIRQMAYRVNVEYCFFIFLVLLINYPYLSGTFVPYHDTLHVFQGFHYFYSHYYFTGEIANWNMYLGLGTNFQQLFVLTPSGYFAMFIGKLLRIENALLLFKWSIVFEQLVMLFGMYRLSRLLFTHSATVIFVCVGAIGSTVWYSQLYWSFRIYYLIPLILYFLFRFFIEKRPIFFWAFGIVSLFSMLGNPPYFGIVLFFICFCIGVVMSLKYIDAWKTIPEISIKNIFAFLLLIILLSAYLTLIVHALRNMSFIAPDRDAAGKTSLDVFLSYGGHIDLKALYHMFLFGWPIHTPWNHAMDNTVYIGLISLFFLVYSFLYVRGIRYLAVLAALIFLIWFSSAGLLATLLYFVPGISLLRHLSLMWGPIKICMLICAGFGLDHYLRAGKRFRPVLIIIIVIFLMDIFAVKYSTFPESWHVTKLCPLISYLRIIVYIVIVYLGLLFCKFISRRNYREVFHLRVTQKEVLIYFCIVAFVFDLLLFQVVAKDVAPNVSKENIGRLYTVRVSYPEFYLERRGSPVSKRSSDAMRLILSIPNTPQINSIIYSFVQFDPLFSKYRKEYTFPPYDHLKSILESRADFMSSGKKILGWHYPKFRLVRKAIFVDTDDEASRIIKNTENLDDIVVLQDILPSVREKEFDVDDSTTEIGTISVLRITANEVCLLVNVKSKYPVWLVYADFYDRTWEAYVNGSVSPIAKAFLAFKAVCVMPGENIVDFSYSKGLMPKMSNIIFFLGFGFGALIVVQTIRTIFSSTSGKYTSKQSQASELKAGIHE